MITEKPHCRVCFQSLSGMQCRCRQCGDIDRRRVLDVVARAALKVAGVAAIAAATWAVFRLAT